MKYILISVLLSTPGLPQTHGGEVRSSGNCSSAVSGNNNRVTITCPEMSKEQADDMVRLMNRILSQQVDPKKVYSELDKIHGAVNDLNTTINPFGNAPKEVTDEVMVSQRLLQNCDEFVRQWGNAGLHATQEAQKRLLENVTRPPATRTSNDGSPAVNAQFAADYNQTLGPRLLEWRARILAHASFLRSTQDWRNSRDYEHMAFICKSAHQLAKFYVAWQSADYDLVKESGNLTGACDSFAENWSKAQPGGGAAQFQIPNPYAMQAAVNAEYATKYKQTLEGELTAWRDQTLKQMPDQQHKDYSLVAEPSQLGMVCADVGSLMLSYRAKVADDIRNGRTQTRSKK